MLADSAPVVAVPVVGSGPLQPPEAVQDAALLELHVRVEALPATMVCGLGVKLTVGAGGVTVTVAVALPLPPEPLQVRVKVVVAASWPVEALPLICSTPLQPPEAVQLVALLLVQLRVEELPAMTLCGSTSA